MLFRSLDGGTNGSNPTSYNEGTGVASFAPATKDGYTFKGWWSAASGGKQISSISSSSTTDMTLYARWEKDIVTHKISYVLDGGTNGSNPTSYNEGTGVASFAPATKDGYTFKGWWSAASGGNQISSINSSSTTDVTLYARWEAVSYTITYNLGGGTNNGSNPTSFTSGESKAIDAATRSNYVFDGWKDSSGKTITSTSQLNGNTTLTAQWLVQYKVYFLNDFDVPMAGYDPIVVTYGKGATAPDGYTAASYGYYTTDFGGWVGVVNGKEINISKGGRIDTLSTEPIEIRLAPQ